MTGRSNTWSHSASESAWPASSRIQRPRSDSTTSARSSRRFWKSSATSRMASTRLCFASSDSGRLWPAPYGVRLHRRARGSSDRPLPRGRGGRRLLLLRWKASRTSTSTPVRVRPLSLGSGARWLALLRDRRRRRRLRRRIGPARGSRAGEHVRPDRRGRRDPRGRVDAGTGYQRPGEHPGRRRCRSCSRRTLRLRRSQRLTATSVRRVDGAAVAAAFTGQAAVQVAI